MSTYEDPNHVGNSPAYHSGKPCIEKGCDRPAGTAWSEHWCFECNVKRMRRIDEVLNETMAMISKRSRGGQ